MSNQIKAIIGTRILVREVKEEKTTESGLILAQLENANQPKKGTVVKAGLEVVDYLKRHAVKPLNKGSIILYDNTSFPMIMDDAAALDVIDLSNLIAIL